MRNCPDGSSHRSVGSGWSELGSPMWILLIPAGRTGDGSIGRLRGFGGILLGDATPPCLHLYRSAPIAARASCAAPPAASAPAVSAPASWRSPTHSTVCHGRKPHGLPA